MSPISVKLPHLSGYTLLERPWTAERGGRSQEKVLSTTLGAMASLHDTQTENNGPSVAQI